VVEIHVQLHHRDTENAEVAQRVGDRKEAGFPPECDKGKRKNAWI